MDPHTAVHEACHCAMAWMLGVDVEAAYARPIHDINSGMTMGGAVYTHATGRERALISLSGKLWQDWPPRYGDRSTHDLQDAHKEVDEHRLDWGELVGVVERLSEKPRFWRYCQATTDALRQGDLDKAQLAEIKAACDREDDSVDEERYAPYEPDEIEWTGVVHEDLARLRAAQRAQQNGSAIKSMSVFAPPPGSRVADPAPIEILSFDC